VIAFSRSLTGSTSTSDMSFDIADGEPSSAADCRNTVAGPISSTSFSTITRL